MKTKLLLVLLAQFMSFTAMAEEVTVNGIHYDVDYETKTASVIFRGYSEITGQRLYYSGDIIIPSSIVISGNEIRVTKINASAFYECKYLLSVEIGDNVTDIGNHAFYCCFALRNVKIGDAVTRIGQFAFYHCDLLASVHIGNSVTYIAENAFCLCYSLQYIDIPNSVTAIRGGAFSGCDKLTTIIMHNGLTEIADGAFGGCRELTSVTIPNSVTNMGAAFQGCEKLESITIPNGINVIPVASFRNCSNLTQVILPESISEIWFYAFDNCTSLSDFYCYATTAPKVDFTDLDGFDAPPFLNVALAVATLHVPASAIEDYRNTAPWSSFGSIVPLTDKEVGIELIKNGQWTMGNEAGTWYTLDGKRLNGKPATKGLFIRNGKKVAVKE